MDKSWAKSWIVNSYVDEIWRGIYINMQLKIWSTETIRISPTCVFQKRSDQSFYPTNETQMSEKKNSPMSQNSLHYYVIPL